MQNNAFFAKSVHSCYWVVKEFGKAVRAVNGIKQFRAVYELPFVALYQRFLAQVNLSVPQYCNTSRFTTNSWRSSRSKFTVMCRRGFLRNFCNENILVSTSVRQQLFQSVSVFRGGRWWGRCHLWCACHGLGFGEGSCWMRPNIVPLSFAVSKVKAREQFTNCHCNLTS